MSTIRAEDGTEQPEREFEMPPIAARDDLPRFLEAEVQVRSGRVFPHDEDQIHPYWSSLVDM